MEQQEMISMELTDMDFKYIRRALVEAYCGECDYRPTFCPYETLLKLFGSGCSWKEL